MATLRLAPFSLDLPKIGTTSGRAAPFLRMQWLSSCEKKAVILAEGNGVGAGKKKRSKK